MLISDWRSDVCSSDLGGAQRCAHVHLSALKNALEYLRTLIDLVVGQPNTFDPCLSVEARFGFQNESSKRRRGVMRPKLNLEFVLRTFTERKQAITQKKEEWLRRDGVTDITRQKGYCAAAYRSSGNAKHATIRSERRREGKGCVR